MVEILLGSEEMKHEFNMKNASGNTPLHEAVYGGKMDIVKHILTLYKPMELFDELCVKEMQNKLGMSPFHVACLEGHEEIVKLLFTSMREQSEQNDQVELNSRECTQLANTCGADMMTPLHLACQNGSSGIVRLLKQNGAKSLRSIDGSYPVHIAARHGHWEVINEVLDGVSVDVEDMLQNTPLNLAAIYNRVKVIEELMDKR